MSEYEDLSARLAELEVRRQQLEQQLKINWLRCEKLQISYKIATVASALGEIYDCHYTKYRYEKDGITYNYDQYGNTITAYKFINGNIYYLYNADKRIFREDELAPLEELYKIAMVETLSKKVIDLEKEIEEMEGKL